MSEATMTVKEAAQLLGIDERSVREKLVAGELAGERRMVGLKPKWFVFPEAVELARQRQGLMRRFKKAAEPGSPEETGWSADEASLSDTDSQPAAAPRPTIRRATAQPEVSAYLNQATDAATQRIAERVLSELPARLREAQQGLVREITEQVVRRLTMELERMLDERMRHWSHAMKNPSSTPTGAAAMWSTPLRATAPLGERPAALDPKPDPEAAAAQYRDVEAKVLYQRLVRLQEEARQHQAENEEMRKELERLRR